MIEVKSKAEGIHDVVMKKALQAVKHTSIVRHYRAVLGRDMSNSRITKITLEMIFRVLPLFYSLILGIIAFNLVV